MITGGLALIILIATVIAGVNGEWGSVAVGAVIIVILLALGSAGRTNARAYNNFVNHWARGGRSYGDSEVERMKRTERLRRELREERKLPPDPSRVLGVKTAGNILETQGTTMKCSWCGHDMEEFNRIRYSSGAEFVTYKCPNCKKEVPVKQ